MNAWVALVVGLLLGWLVEMAIDYFYWRPRRLCPDDTAQAMRGQIGRLEAAKATAGLMVDAQKAQIGELRASAQVREQHLGALQTTLGTHETELATVKADLSARTGEIADWQARHSRLEATLQARESELAAVQAHNQALEADLAVYQAETTTLRGHLDDVDSGLKGLGIGALAGGALGSLGARFAALRERLAGHEDEASGLQAQLTSQETTLTAAQASVAEQARRLGDLTAELSACESETMRLRSELAASSSAAAATQARLSACEAEVTATHMEIESLKAHNLALQGEAAIRAADSADLTAALTRIGALEGELAACQEQARAWQAGAALGMGGAAAALVVGAAGVAADEAEEETPDMSTAAALAAVGPVEENIGMPALDALPGASGLSMVWGLNTQANQRLVQQGITSYDQLAASSATQVDEALSVSQPYYPGMEKAAIHGQWVEQSRLAAADDWDGLALYQAAYDRAALRDDLKLLWGIGPKIEQVLNDNGIYLFAQLASAPAERITEILRRAGPRFRMSGAKLHVSWPEQSRLADAGKWEALQVLTDRLSWSDVH